MLINLYHICTPNEPYLKAIRSVITEVRLFKVLRICCRHPISSDHWILENRAFNSTWLTTRKNRSSYCSTLKNYGSASSNKTILIICFSCTLRLIICKFIFKKILFYKSFGEPQAKIIYWLKMSCNLYYSRSQGWEPHLTINTPTVSRFKLNLNIVLLCTWHFNVLTGT